MITLYNVPSRKQIRRSITPFSVHASLAALAPVIEDKQIFATIHQQVQIPPKQVWDRPTDKLVFVTLGILAGSQTVYALNSTLRVDRPLLHAFGYPACADQSVIQQTLNACTEANVGQLEEALDQLWRQHSLTVSLSEKAFEASVVVTMDMDLSGQPSSKKAQQATKGYFPAKKNS